MTKAEDVLKTIESSTFSAWAGYRSKMVVDSFREMLDRLGYQDVVCSAGFTLNSGILVRLTSETLDVTLQFTVEDNGAILRIIPAGREESVELDLEAWNPPLAIDLMVPDVFDLSWFDKDLMRGIELLGSDGPIDFGENVATRSIERSSLSSVLRTIRDKGWI